MTSAEIKVEGMSCQHCVMSVRKAVEGLDGIKSSNVEIGKVSVEFDEGKVSKDAIEAAITKAGYKVVK
jgi:copper ion binding protein